MIRLICFLFLILIIRQNDALYFIMRETDKKCFVEEVPDQTMITGHYKMSVFDMQSKTYKQMPQLGLHVDVTDPDNEVILSRVYTNEGRFTFTTSKPGEHVICLYSNTTRWSSGTNLKVDFSIQAGDHAQDYAQIAVKERLNELQVRVRQLMDQTEQMTKEQNYQRFREEIFRQLSESTNQRVLWWAVAQTAVVLLTGFWQMRHLKGFFEAKKLV